MPSLELRRRATASLDAINEAADQEPSALDEENAWIAVLADVEPTVGRSKLGVDK